MSKGVAAGLGSFAVLVVLIRLFLRIRPRTMGGLKFGWDDLCVVLATLALLPFTATIFIESSLGYGRDVWTLNQDNVPSILFWYWVAELLYAFTTAMIKLSLLSFYIRIFPPGRLHIVVYITMAVCVAYMVSFIFVLGFQCSPVQQTWQSWDNTHPGNCISINAAVWALGAINIALDIPTMGIPIPQLAALNLPWVKKTYILLMFGLGFLYAYVREFLYANTKFSIVSPLLALSGYSRSSNTLVLTFSHVSRSGCY